MQCYPLLQTIVSGAPQLSLRLPTAAFLRKINFFSAINSLAQAPGRFVSPGAAPRHAYSVATSHFGRFALERR
jgi:hypothetical protein